MRTDARPVPRSVLAALIAVSFALLAAPPAGAATIAVPGDQPTIQDAVDAANHGDTIQVAAGTYTEQVEVDGKTITIDGAGPSTILRLPASATTPVTTRVAADSTTPIVHVIDAPFPGVTISDVAIDATNLTGSVTGILTEDSKVTVHDVTANLGTGCDAPCKAMRFENSVQLVAHTATLSDSTVAGATVRAAGDGLVFAATGSTFTGESETNDFETLLEITAAGSWQVTGSQFSGTTGNAVHATDSAFGQVSTSTFTGRGTGVRDDDSESDMDALTLSDNTFTDRTSNSLIAIGIDAVTATGNRVTARNSSAGFSIYTAATATVTGNNIVGGSPPLTLDSVGSATVRFNRFAPRSGFSWVTGVSLYGTTGAVDATDNFWGCNDGPTTADGCTNIFDTTSPAATVDASTWLVLGATAVPSSIGGASTSAITADLTRDNNGDTPAGNTLPEQDISFTTTRGRVDDPVKTTSGWVASTTLHTGSRTGTAHVRASLDNAAPLADVTISAASSDPSPGAAAVTVDTAGNDTTCARFGSACATIQRAVDIAATGDVISIGAGLFTEQVATTKGVTLQGQGDSTILRLPAVPATAYVSRESGHDVAPILYVADVPLGTFVLRDVKISAINLDYEATALLSEDAPVVVDHVTVDAPGCEETRGCQAFRFENAWLQGHEVTLRNSTITGATVWFRGFGLVGRVEDSTFADGGAHADFYGQVYFRHVKDWLVEDSSFTDASRDAVYGDASFAGEIRDSVFDHSTVRFTDGQGTDGDSLVIDGSAFTNQTADLVAFAQSLDAVTITENRWRRQGTSTGTGLVLSSDETVTVSGNDFSRFQPAVSLSGATTGTVRFNRFGPRYSFSYATGLASDGTAAIDATDNFWGCSSGPTTDDGCMNVVATGGGTVDASTWLVLEASASPGSIPLNGSSTVTGRLTRNNNGSTPSGNTLGEQDVGFTTTRGNLDEPRVTTTGRVASTTLRGGSYAGTAHVRAGLDNASATDDVTIGAAGADPAPGPSVVSVSTGGNDLTCTRNGSACETVQHAIDIAQTGDVVSIGAGTFSEQLEIDKALTVRGQGAGSTIVQLPLVPQPVVTRLASFGSTVTPVIHVDDVLAGRVWLRDLRIGESGVDSDSAGLLVEDAPVLVDHVSFLATDGCTASRLCYAMRFESVFARAQEDTIRDATITKAGVRFEGYGITARVEGSTFTSTDDGGSNGTTDPVNLRNVEAWHVEDNAFSDGRDADAVEANGFGSGEFVDNTVDALSEGVLAYDGDTLVVDDATMTGMRGGVDTRDVNNVTVTDVSVAQRFPGSSDGGVRVFDATTATILRNELVRFLPSVQLTRVGTAAVLYNRLTPNDPLAASDGLRVLGTTPSAVDARWNWWGCNDGPDAIAGCTTATNTSPGTVDTSRWYVLGSTKSSGVVRTGVTSDITASLTKDNTAATISPNDLPEQDIAFTTNAGSLSHATRTTVNHATQSTLSYAAPDAVATVHVKLDNADLTHTIYNDNTVPDTTVTAPSGVVGTHTPTMHFTANETATFACQVDSGTPFACVDGDPLPSAADGAHTLKVTATDTAGNIEAAPGQSSFTVDTTNPVTSINTGPFAITRDTTPTWTFSAVDATTTTFKCAVYLRTDPQPALTTCTSAYTSAALPEGDYYFVVQGTDAAGNTGNTALAPFTLDTDHITIVDALNGTSDTSGCGTSTNPCNTMQNGVGNAVAGDTVDVRAGVYTEGGTDVDKTLTIAGSGPTTIVRVSPNSEGLRILADDVTIHDLKVTFTGVSTIGTRGIVPGNTVTGTTLHHLAIDTLATGVVVRNQPAHQFVLRDSALSNLGTSLLGDGTHSNVSIHDNAFTSQGAVGTFTGSGTGVSFADNTMAFGAGSGLYFDDTANLTVSGNDFALYDVAFSLGGGNSNVTVSDNTMHDGDWQAVTINGSGNSGVAFTHNTILNFSSSRLFQVASGSITGTLHIHRNRLVNANLQGIVNNGATIDATNNWWGCNGGPNTAGCPSTSGGGATDTDPWLRLTATSPTTTIKPNAVTALQATVGKNSDGVAVADPFPPATISFSSGSGAFGPGYVVFDASDGHADTTWFAAAADAALAASLDYATVSVPITVSASAGDGGSRHLPGGGHFETGNGVDATDRQDASIDLPFGTSGVVTLQETPTSGSGYSVPAGHGWMTTGFTISAPDPGAGNQLTLTFLAYLPGIPLSEVEIFRNGVEVSAACPADPCLQGVTDLGGGVFRIVVKTRFASFWVVGGPDPTVVMLSGPGVAPTSPYTNNPLPNWTFKTQINGIDVPNGSVQYACTIIATVACTSGFTAPAPPLAEGPQQLAVQASVAGLAGPETLTAFFVDTAPPVPTIDSGPTQPYTASQSATFTFSPHDPAPSSGIASVVCALDGAATPCTFPKTGLAEGPHSFFVTYTDNAGNSASSATYDWRIDLTDPTTTITGTKPGLDQGIQFQGAPTYATRSDDATFSHSSSDPPSPAGNASGVASVQCRLDGGLFGACPASYTGLAHGVHTFEVRAIDNVGHVGTADSWTWFVDLRAPDITPTYPYPNGRFNYYKPNDDVVADYSCDDRQVFPGPTESGVATCDGTVPFGSPFDRTSLGAPVDDLTPRVYPFQIDTTDNVGNAGSTSFAYRVFTFAGLILDDSPEAYFRMNDPEVSTTLDDVSGNGNDGTYKNGTMSGPIGVSGDDDTARVFTGADGYGFVNDMAAPPFGYTMSAFVQFSNAEDGMVMQHGRNGAIYRRGNAIVFHQTDDDVALTIPGGIVAGCWYFVAGRWDGFQATVYAGTHDGPGECTGDASDLRWFTPQSITSTSKPSGDGSTFYVGYGDQAQWLHGLLDEVAYFYSDIGATHVKELWLADPPPGVRRVLAGSTFTQPSSSKPAVTPAAGKPNPKAAVKAKVRALTRQLAAARKQLKILQRRHAKKARIAAARRSVAKLQRQLRTAKRRL